MAEAITRSGLRVETTIPERRGIIGNTGFDLYFGRYYPDYPDTDGFAYGLLHSTAGILGPICGSDAIDELLYRGRQETEPHMRVDIYRELERHVYDQSLILPLFHEQSYCFARPEVEGFGVRRFFPTVPYEEMSITRGR